MLKICLKYVIDRSMGEGNIVVGKRYQNSKFRGGDL